MNSPLNRIIIYTRHMDAMVVFYQRYFGFSPLHDEQDRIVELRNPAGGVILMLHPASKGQKQGQSLAKLVFDVEDVERFCAECEKRGLAFGPVHKVDGYAFANAKDPSGNTVSVSGRAFRHQRPEPPA